MVKRDQSKAFYQYPLNEKSSKEMSFVFTGKNGKERKFVWRVLAFGVSAATFIVQSINRVLVDYYSLKFNRYALVYIDDYGFEKEDSIFDDLAGELGIIFNPKKNMEGAKVQLLGWELDFEKKLAVITKDKRAKIEKAAAIMLEEGKVTIEHLQSFVGRIGFAARASKLGRLNSFFIERLLAQQQSEGNDVDLKFVCNLGEHHKQEVRYWRDMNNHLPIEFVREKRLTLEVGAFTDSSSKKWAWKLGDKTRAGAFDEEKMSWPIILKEAWALKKFLEDNNFLQTELEVLVDNEPLVRSFNKKFSKNAILHQLIKEIYLANFKLGNRIKLKWIPTLQMAQEGADGASREVYLEDENSLSEKGVEKAKKVMSLGSEDELFDLFASPADNVFKVHYFSNQIDLEDPLSMEEGAFELLNRLAGERRRLGNIFWAFPPNALVKGFLFTLRQVGVDGTVFLLVDSDRVTESVKILTKFFKFEIIKFSRMRDTRLYRNRPQIARSIIKIKNLNSE